MSERGGQKRGWTYDRGDDAEGELMQPLGLTRVEKSALMGFLKTLTDVRYQRAS